MNYSSALVTGGSGFIGSHLVDALVEGGVKVTVLDLVDPKEDRKNEKVTYVKGDIRDKDLGVFLKAVSPDVVFHLAAHIDDRASVLDPVMNADHNELGSINVFEQAKRVGVKKILFASSCAVYGLPESLPIAETVMPRPRTPYGISKWVAEHYLDAMSLQSDVVAVALRFANVYGPRQDGSKESGATAVFTSKLLGGVAPFMNADGTTTRDYVFVGDVVKALIAASEGNVSGVFNVGTGREVNTKDLFLMIQQSVGTSIEPVMRPDVKDAVVRMALDARKMKEMFGWVPEVNLEEGIKKTVQWYQGVS